MAFASTSYFPAVAGAGGDAELTSGDTADIVLTDATTNAASTIQTLTHRTTGTPATNLALEVLYKIEDSANNDQSMAAVRVVATDVTDASEDASYRIGVVTAGSIPAAGSEQFILTGATIRLPALGKIEFGSANTYVSADGVGQFDFFANSVRTFRGTATYVELNAVVYVGATGTGRVHAGTVDGGDASGANLTFTSTSHATKGKVYLGAAQTSAYDEVNERFGIGTSGPSQVAHFKVTGASSIVLIESSAAASYAGSRHTVSGAVLSEISQYGTSYAGSDATAAGTLLIYAASAAVGGLALASDGAGRHIKFYSGGVAAANLSATVTDTGVAMANDKLFTLDTNAGITASTTQTQGQGALTAQVNEVATCANANDVVTMPAAVAGLRITIINNGAQTLQIFPASGDAFSGSAGDASTTLATATNKSWIAFNATTWEVD
jgi:hypothetical protein